MIATFLSAVTVITRIPITRRLIVLLVVGNEIRGLSAAISITYALWRAGFWSDPMKFFNAIF